MSSRYDSTRVGSTAPIATPRSLHALRRALLATLVGLLLTGLLTWWRLSVDARIEADQLSERGQLLAFETRDLLDEAAMQLTAAAGLFRASDHVTAEEFRVFVEDLGLMPGVLGLGYVPVVFDAQLDEWLARAKTEIPDLKLFELDDEGNPVPLRDREVRFPLLYFEPSGGPVAANGVDMGSEQQRIDQVLGTLKTEPVAMSTFLGDDVAPIPTDGYVIMARAIREPHSEVFSEFVIGVIDVNGLINGNTADEVTDGLVWSIEDGTRSPEQATLGDAWKGTVAFGGRVLRFSVSPDESGYPWPTGLAGLMLLAGIAISLLVGVVVHLVLRRLEARGEMEVLESINEGKDEFLAAVSHRLRTPLTAVVGFSEVLRESDEGLSEADRRELVSTIAVQAIELGHLFDNLLTVTRDTDRYSFVSSHVHLAQETYAVLDTADPERRVKTRVTSADREVVAAGDSALVRQILRNLLANATDFGERVEISVTGTDLMARVAVRDSGPGVPHGREKDIFALYGSRGEIGQPDSMGVGLYVSRRLARRMSGDLTYRREDGWTVFELTLPAVPAVIETRPKPEPATTRN